MGGFSPDLVLAEATALDSRNVPRMRSTAKGEPQPVLIAMVEAGDSPCAYAEIVLRKPLTAERLEEALDDALRLRGSAPPLRPKAN